MKRQASLWGWQLSSSKNDDKKDNTRMTHIPNAHTNTKPIIIENKNINNNGHQIQKTVSDSELNYNRPHVNAPVDVKINEFDWKTTKIISTSPPAGLPMLSPQNNYSSDEEDFTNIKTIRKQILGSSVAKKFIIDNSYEYNMCGDDQITIIPDALVGYDNILNDTGKRELKNILRKLNALHTNGIIYEYKFRYLNSGLWSSDPNLKPIYSFNNIRVEGFVYGSSLDRNEHHMPIITSIVQFYNEKEGWIATQSGSIYQITSAALKREHK